MCVRPISNSTKRTAWDSTSEMRFITAFVVAGLTIGCTTVNPDLRVMERVAIDEVPNDEKAYIIINASFLPKDRPQPTRIALAQMFTVEYLTTSKDVFEVAPTKSKVVYLYFAERPMPGFESRISLRYNKRQSPIVKLKAGNIYFYGRVEVDNTGHRTLVRTVRDLDLIRRACQQAPEVFEKFEVVPIGPVAQDSESLPTCDELLNVGSVGLVKGPE